MFFKEEEKIMKKYTLIFLVVSLILVSMLSNVSAEDKTVVNFWTFIDPSGKGVRSEALKYVIENFKEKYHDIDVDTNIVAWREIDSMLLRAAQTKSVPDVVMIYQPSLRMHVSAGTIQPLDKFVASWTEEQKNDFLAPWEQTVVNGHKYGFFYDHRISGLVYRKDLLEKEGLKEPNSLQELGEIAGKLNNPPNMIGFARGITVHDPIGGMENVLSIVASEGGKLLNEDGTAAWNSPAWEKTVQYWVDLVYKYKAMPLGVALEMSDFQYDLLLSGKCVFYPQLSHRVMAIRDSSGLGEKIQYMPMPSFKEGKPSPTLMLGWTLVMPEGSKDSEAAWKFIEHFISPEMQLHFAKIAGNLPVRKSVFNDPWFDTPEAKTILEIASITKGTDVVSIALPERVNEVFSYISEAFEKAVSKETSPKEVLEETANRWNTKYCK